jgi:FkbM family methyltransferase
MHHQGYLVENDLFWRGLAGWEKVSLEVWKRLCASAHVIMDVGANTGVYALLAHCVRPEATIIALEPVHRVYEKLKANIRLNNAGIQALEMAVTNKNGPVPIYDRPEVAHEYDSTLNREFSLAHPDARAVEVTGATLDTIARDKRLQRVDLIKIDVETHEPEVLEGALELVRRDLPSMLIEVLTEEVAARLAVLLEGLPYVFFQIREAAWPPLQVDQLRRGTDRDLLVCTKEKALSIGLSVRE